MGKKITQLATITEVADDDLLVGVDVSDTSGSDNGTNKKFTKASLLQGLAPLDPQRTGWNPDEETWVYHNVDNPTGYIKIEGKDVSANYSVGMRIMFTNGGNIVKGILTAVVYSNPNTILTFLHEINPANSQALHLLQNSAITNNYYSTHKAPLGFPVDEDSWSVKVSSSISQDATSNSVSGTVYNVPSLDFVMPIGEYKVKYLVNARVYNLNAPADLKTSFSTSSSSATNTELSTQLSMSAVTSGQIIMSQNNYFPIKNTAKTTWYVVMWASLTGCGFGIRGDLLTCFIKATCAYL